MPVSWVPAIQIALESVLSLIVDSVEPRVAHAA